MISLKKWQESKEELATRNVKLPTYDVVAVKNVGKEEPVWIHFGGGNLYRGFHAEIAQRLIEEGKLKSGVIVCETLDKNIIDDIYAPFNQDLLQVIMHENGSLEKKINAATADSYFCNPDRQEDFKKVQKYFMSPTLQFATFTITEKGYVLNNPDGSLTGMVKEDLRNGPDSPRHTMSIVTSLLYKRFEAGALPIAMVSTDNFSQNGERFKTSILTIAEGWKKNNLVHQGFVDYLRDDTRISFPWSMIDRITPNPSESVKKGLEAVGFCDMDIVHTPKQTTIAPFANTEVVHYLVLEDNFPNGRPDLSAGGVVLTDRETVDKADTMKVTACLNPLHTALAIFGCLLGYTSIADEMKNKDLVNLIKQIGYREGLPVVSNPKIIHPTKFIDEVINKRLPNPFIPDTPQRIACDTSQKVAIRFGKTIKAYQTLQGKNVNELTFIPLTIAGWLRYLIGIDDQGKKFIPSQDPLLEKLQQELSQVYLGISDMHLIHKSVTPILSNDEIFGVNLYEVGLGEKIERFYLEMLSDKGAVQRTLHYYLNKE
ncbi:mannitol dehydrogenase family protein [Virgibacillus pantothenticus]|uniref:mannitol dehydrogenase family protein n=1 Tax=Virgibacillus pantothenticus TaxID=1473 RepID=UPI000987BFE5|nr:mannitol dehydrogenase family protein [Virgibacillus pantothenticus]